MNAVFQMALRLPRACATNTWNFSTTAASDRKNAQAQRRALQKPLFGNQRRPVTIWPEGPAP
jgi:hypothetical protein